MIATLVDWGALWRTVYSAAIAGVLITACCSFGVLGAARASERRAAGGGAAPWVVLATAGSIATLLVVAYGIQLIIDK